MEMNSVIRIEVTILDNEKASFVGRVVRMEISEQQPSRFLIGVKIEEIDDESRKIIDEFIKSINIYNVLDKIKLDNIVDIHFVSGQPPILKKVGKMEIADILWEIWR